MKKWIFTLLAGVIMILVACNPKQKSLSATKPNKEVQTVQQYLKDKDYTNFKVATFAGGCFWCTEASFERILGVVDVFSGYSGGEKSYPNYEEVARGLTKHAESIQVYYDPNLIDYQKLLEVFFVGHDPTTLNRQGPDIGPHYRSAIFYHNDQQKELAESYIKKLDKEGKYATPIVTEITPFKEFWVAEGYHQDYYEHNPGSRYIQMVSKPKVEKVKKEFADILKEKYKSES